MGSSSANSPSSTTVMIVAADSHFVPEAMGTRVVRSYSPHASCSTSSPSCTTSNEAPGRPAPSTASTMRASRGSNAGLATTVSPITEGYPAASAAVPLVEPGGAAVDADPSPASEVAEHAPAMTRVPTTSASFRLRRLSTLRR